MTQYQKYEEIRKMTKEDRREIYQFAMKRSREMLAGIETEKDDQAPQETILDKPHDSISVD